MNHFRPASPPAGALFLALLALALPSCGGGGGGSGTPPVATSQAQVSFPSTGAVTTAANLTIRGSTSGNEPVARVDVQGVAATTTDDFATWSADIPLAPGRNAVQITLTEQAGWVRTIPSAVVIERTGAVLLQPKRLAVEPFRNSYLVLDQQQKALVRADPAAATTEILSAENRGSGAELSNPTCLAYDVGGDRIWIGDSGTNAILEIDPVTGDRRVLVDRNSVPSALSGILTRPSELVFDGDNQRLVVSDSGSDTVYAVNIGTGAITLISGGNTSSSNLRRGTGPSLFTVTGMDLDLASRRAILVDSQADQIVSVNLLTGDRASLSSNSSSQGNEPRFFTPLGLVLDPTLQFAYTANLEQEGSPNSILQINLSTGARQIFNGVGVGSGPDLLAPEFCQLDTTNGRLLVGDSQLQAVVAIDLASATRTKVVGNTRAGSGMRLNGPEGAAVDRRRNQLLVVSSDDRRLAAIDLANGNRTTLATFDNQVQATDVTIDTQRDRALVTDRNQDRVFEVDLATGAVSPLLFDNKSNTRSIAYDPTRDLALITTASSSGNVFQIYAIELGNPNSSGVLATRLLSRSNSPAAGSGTALRDIADLEVDSDNDLLLVLDRQSNQLTAVDLDTGNRSELSGSNRGNGTSFDSVIGVSLDLVTSRVLVLNDSGTELLAVDLSTGDRTVISATEFGSGPALLEGISVATSSSSVLVFDETFGLITIDRATGNRIITSSRGAGQ